MDWNRVARRPGWCRFGHCGNDDVTYNFSSGAGIAGAQSIHANVYATQPVAKFATKEHRERMLPKLIGGEWRACFGVTELNIGLEALKLKTQAIRDGDEYRISGQKIWISSAQVASKMILLARTTPLEQVNKPPESLSLFFIDFDKSAPGLELRRIKKWAVELLMLMKSSLTIIGCLPTH